MVVPPMNFEVETLLGPVAAFYNNVSVNLAFTDQSKVDVEVSREGIHLKVCNIEAQMREAVWGYEQPGFPYLHGGGTLEAEALGGDLSLLVTCKQQIGACNLFIEPEVVNVGRLMISVEGSWNSLVYNTLIGVLKPQIKEGLEVAIQGALRNSGQVINNSMEWLAVLVLAVMQAEEDESIAADSGFDLMTEGKGRHSALNKPREHTCTVSRQDLVSY